MQKFIKNDSFLAGLPTFVPNFPDLFKAKSIGKNMSGSYTNSTINPPRLSYYRLKAVGGLRA